MAKVELCACNLAARGCGAQIRFPSTLSLWWERTHYSATQGRREHPGYQSLPSRGFPSYLPIDQPERKDEQLGACVSTAMDKI